MSSVLLARMYLKVPFCIFNIDDITIFLHSSEIFIFLPNESNSFHCGRVFQNTGFTSLPSDLSQDKGRHL